MVSLVDERSFSCSFSFFSSRGTRDNCSRIDSNCLHSFDFAFFSAHNISEIKENLFPQDQKRDKANALLSQIFSLCLVQKSIDVYFADYYCSKVPTLTLKPVSTKTVSAQAAVASHHVGTRRIAMTTVSTFFTLIYI